jgi:hypothetical protein
MQVVERSKIQILLIPNHVISIEIDCLLKMLTRILLGLNTSKLEVKLYGLFDKRREEKNNSKTIPLST